MKENHMADRNTLSQMLESLVNGDQAKAEELFHEYVVAQSREIYESLIESEMEVDEEMDDEEKDGEDSEGNKKVDESGEDLDEDGEDLDENFEDLAIEGDDDEMGGDATDDLAGELDGEEGDMDDMSDDMADKDPAELFQDLDSIVDELQAKFDAMNGDDMGGDDMAGMGDDEEMKDEFDLATVREYVEKVPAGHGAEKKGAAESGAENNGMKFSKNDMGGTAGNILSGRNGADSGSQGMTGDLKGSGLLKGKPQLQDGGNVNTPGAKNGNAFSKKEPGHGAEKAGSKESADKGAGSLFRGRR
jgi:hypothetical protein